MKMKFYGPTGDQNIIREINIDFHDKDLTTALFEEMDFTIGASDTEASYTVTTTITNDGTE